MNGENSAEDNESDDMQVPSEESIKLAAKNSSNDLVNNYEFLVDDATSQMRIKRKPEKYIFQNEAVRPIKQEEANEENKVEKDI